MTKTQKFLTVPNEVAKNTKIGDTFEIEGTDYNVESIHRDKEGSQLELIHEDEAQQTVALDLDSENDLSMTSQ